MRIRTDAVAGAATDEELMVRTRQGDRDAFAGLIHRRQQGLVNLFRRMGAHKDEAEDLVQETFMRLFAYRERYEPKGSLKGLLYVMARHAWADMARREARRPAANSEALEIAAAPEPVHMGEHLDVQAALEELSEKLRTVVVLNVYEGLKQQEIAGVLGIPLGTVKSRMHLAFKQLRARLCAEAVASAS